MTGAHRTERVAGLLTYLSTVQAHLAKNPALAVPFAVTVETNRSKANVVVQLDGPGRLSRVADGLLTWADTLTDVACAVWRPSHGGTVHLSITGRTGGVAVWVYDAVDWDPDVFGDLAPRTERSATLAQLRSWALAVEVTG